MQDIDFDEIDRAVSSVSTPRSRVDTPTVTPTDTPVAAPAVASPAVRRSSGRFMDVVHPSSDMRPMPERQQTASFSALQRDTTVSAPVAPVQPLAPAPVATAADAPAAFHWPDPVEAQKDVTPVVASEAVVDTFAEPTPEIMTTEDEQDDEDIAGPLESPFLSNAKVEKRPLGAFSDPDPELLTLDDLPSSHVATPEPSTESTPEIEIPTNHEEPAEIPAELSDDVLLLEAHAEDEPKSNDAPTATNSPAPEEIPIGPTSITQQYKEQPNTTNEQSGAIFDTEVYNQALVHAPKNNKRTLIIVWIVALILVGGGIGAGVYYVLLPMLG